MDNSIVGRMFFVYPSDNERFCLRILLLYRNGCTAFESIRTVNTTVYYTFKETCVAIGFMDNDNESNVCLNEASSFATSQQMRELFALILLNCAPLNPRELWDTFKNHFSDDISHKLRRFNQNLELNDEIYNVAPNLINEILIKTGNHISNYSNLPQIWTPQNFEEVYVTNNLIQEEMQYNIEGLELELEQNLPKFNKDKK